MIKFFPPPGKSVIARRPTVVRYDIAGKSGAALQQGPRPQARTERQDFAAAAKRQIVRLSRYVRANARYGLNISAAAVVVMIASGPALIAIVRILRCRRARDSWGREGQALYKSILIRFLQTTPSMRPIRTPILDSILNE